MHFCSEKNTKTIEKIQERALRFIYEDYENTYERFAFIKFLENQSIKIMLSFSGVLTTVFILVSE
jgi:histone acetyltransferase (RNA polymerase elongator complex component)